MKNEILVFVAIQLSFFVGYLFGKSKGTITVSSDVGQGNIVNQRQSTQKKSFVKIDEARFVTRIADDSFEKRNNQLGNSVAVEDDIGSSVSRLAKLKSNR